MIHPALLILAKNPEILADHAEAYTDLIGESLKSTMITWRRRAACQFAAALFMMLSLIFTGIAAMLWGGGTGVNYQAPWLLVVVPILPLLLALALWQCSSKIANGPDALEVLKSQVRADLAVLRQQYPS
jgi:hypothetical protein